jgi:hypothetical protein
MKIFISWSGKFSQHTAISLKEWLPLIFPGIETFVSSESVRKGKRWSHVISKELATTNFGIVCLTPDNLEAPWLLFESGALSKSVSESSVFTLLFNELKPTDVKGPLEEFQHTRFEKEDFYKLVKAVNEVQGSAKHQEKNLLTIFNKMWDDLETEIHLGAKAKDVPEIERDDKDMLRELLEIARQIAKDMPRNSIPLGRSISEVINRTIKSQQKDLWDKFLAIIGSQNLITHACLSNAMGAGLDGNTFTILFPPKDENLIKSLDTPGQIKLFQSALAELGYNNKTKIKFMTLGDS